MINKPYEIYFTKEAKKDIAQLSDKLRHKLKNILTDKIANFPFLGKKLKGDLQGFYSFRLDYKDRIVYSIDQQHHIIYVHRVKTHYGD